MISSALISVKTDGGYKTAWCHYQGTPMQLGKVLNQKVLTQEVAEELVSLQYMSMLMRPIEYKEQCEIMNRKKRIATVKDVQVGKLAKCSKQEINAFDFIHFTERNKQGFYVYREQDVKVLRNNTNGSIVFGTKAELSTHWRRVFKYLDARYLFIFEDNKWSWQKTL